MKEEVKRGDFITFPSMDGLFFIVGCVHSVEDGVCTYVRDSLTMWSTNLMSYYESGSVISEEYFIDSVKVNARKSGEYPTDSQIRETLKNMLDWDWTIGNMHQCMYSVLSKRK
jgi:hypothetical protein